MLISPPRMMMPERQKMSVRLIRLAFLARAGGQVARSSLAPAGRRKTNLTVAEAPQIAKQTYSIPCVLYV